MEPIFLYHTLPLASSQQPLLLTVDWLTLTTVGMQLHLSTTLKQKPEMLISTFLLLSHLSRRGIPTRSVTCSRAEEPAHSLGPFYKRWNGWAAKQHPKISQILSACYLYSQERSLPWNNWLTVLNGLIFSVKDHASYNAVKKSEPKVNPDPQVAFTCPKRLHCSSTTLIKPQLSSDANSGIATQWRRKL